MSEENKLSYDDISDVANVWIEDFYFMGKDARHDPNTTYEELEASKSLNYSAPFDEPTVDLYGGTMQMATLSDNIVGTAKTLINCIPEPSWGFGEDTKNIEVRKGDENTNNIDFYLGDKLVGRAHFDIVTYEESYGLEFPDGTKAEDLEYGISTWKDLEAYEQKAAKAAEDEFSDSITGISEPSNDDTLDK